MAGRGREFAAILTRSACGTVKGTCAIGSPGESSRIKKMMKLITISVGTAIASRRSV